MRVALLLLMLSGCSHSPKITCKAGKVMSIELDPETSYLKRASLVERAKHFCARAENQIAFQELSSKENK